MSGAWPAVLKTHRHGRFAPAGLDEKSLVPGVRQILLRRHETSSKHGPGSTREQGLADLPAVTDAAGG